MGSAAPKGCLWRGLQCMGSAAPKGCLWQGLQCMASAAPWDLAAGAGCFPPGGTPAERSATQQGMARSQSDSCMALSSGLPSRLLHRVDSPAWLRERAVTAGSTPRRGGRGAGVRSGMPGCA